MRVSVIGLGRMGRGMARNLARRGHEVRGYDVSEEAVRAAGVPPCEVPRCFEADYVVLALPTGREVLDVLRSAPASTDAVIVDTTTQSLSELRRVLEAAGGLKYLTCRVERGPRDAEEGRLVLYVGGPRDLFERASEFLAQLGEPIYAGTHEQATALKLVSTALLAANTAALAEAAEILRRLGLDPDSAIAVLSKGGAASAQLSARMPAMLRGQFPVGFSAQQAETVLRQLQELAEELGVEVLPVLGRVRELLREAAAAGIGGSDIAELALYVKALNVQSPHSPHR